MSAGFQHDLAPRLLQNQPAGALAADEQLIDLQMGAMPPCDGNLHRRVLEEDQPDLGERPGLQLGLKGLAALRLGVMSDQGFTRNTVPIIKPVARVNFARREQPLHPLVELRVE
jgi:hypothetical protein